MKKLICLLLSVMMLVSVCPVTALAETLTEEPAVVTEKDSAPAGDQTAGDTPNWKNVTNGGSITITNTLRDDTPGTGDNTKTLLWTGLTLASAIGCGGALMIASRKKKEDTEK